MHSPRRERKRRSPPLPLPLCSLRRSPSVWWADTCLRNIYRRIKVKTVTRNCCGFILDCWRCKFILALFDLYLCEIPNWFLNRSSPILITIFDRCIREPESSSPPKLKRQLSEEMNTSSSGNNFMLRELELISELAESEDDMTDASLDESRSLLYAASSKFPSLSARNKSMCLWLIVCLHCISIFKSNILYRKK